VIPHKNRVAGMNLLSKRIAAAEISGILLLLLWLTGCLPSRILVSPVPDHIERLEGYARLKLQDGSESSNTKFSFLFILPHQGQIEVSDFLGRSLYKILITERGAYFIVPTKKAFWRASEEAIIDKFLGFRLSLAELICLFSGQWPAPHTPPEKVASWALERDEAGRIISGQRGDLNFHVESFIEETAFARSLTFLHSRSRGHLKFLKIVFNQTGANKVFDADFLAKYTEKTWEEIRERLGNES